MVTRLTGVAGLTGLVLLAAACGGTVHRAVRVSTRSPGESAATATPTSSPATPEVPSRLARPVTLSNGQWDLFPPRPTDTTSLTYDQVAGHAPSFNSDGSPSRPIVVLARFSDALISNDPPPSIQGATGMLGWAPVPHDQLVVVVLRYGPNLIPPTGPVGWTGPLPTGPATYVSNVWILDAATGRGLYGASYPGVLPTISTVPGTAPSVSATTTSLPAGATETFNPGVSPPGTGLRSDGGAVTIVPVPASQHSALTASDAYDDYVKWEGGTPRYATAPEYLYGLFTDTTLADPSVSGSSVPHYRQVPAWAVIFHNVMARPAGTSDQELGRTDVMDIVNDATGKVLEELVGPVTLTAS